MRRVVHAFLVLLTLIIGAISAVVVVTQTTWFRDWLRGYVVREADRYLNGQVSIERLGGNLLFGVEMERVAISMDGKVVVSVDDLGLRYSIFDLVSRGLSVDEIRLERPTLYLRHEGDTWPIARLLKRQEREVDRQGPAFPMAIDAIVISDATIVVDEPQRWSAIDVPRRIDRLDAKMSFEYEPVHYAVEIDHMSFRAEDPAVRLVNLSGGVAVRDDAVYVERIVLRTDQSEIRADGAVQHYLTKPNVNIRISSNKLSLQEIAGLVPGLAGVTLQPAFELSAAGPADSLAVEATVRSAAGEATGSFVADVAMPGQSINGAVSIRHLNLAPIVNDRRQATDLTAEASLDLRADGLSDLSMLQGTVALNAPSLVAGGYAAQNITMRGRVEGRRIEGRGQATGYGAHATVAGRVTLPEGSEPLSYDVHGRASQIDLRRVPRQFGVRPAQTDMQIEFHVRGTEPSRRPGARVIDARLRFDDSTVAGARIARGSTARLSLRGPVVAFETDATLAGLDLQRVGSEFGVPVLDSDRYASQVNGHVQANGQGSTLEDMKVAATGTLSDSSILDGRFSQLSFDLSATGATARVKATGAFAEFDPAALTGRSAMKGSVTGSVEVDGAIDDVSAGVTAQSVNGTARVMLEPSTIGGLVIDEAILDGDYRDRSGVIRQFKLAGPDLNAQAAGALTFQDSGESNLSFEAESSTLARIGGLVEIPMSGLARIEGKVAGNGTMLRVAGTLTGGNLKYGENDVLSLSAPYTARMPDLDLARADVAVEAEGTFVTLAGQQINELTVQANYDHQQIEFDATARQPRRSLAAAGSMTLHADHREVHLRRIALDTEGLNWQMAPGAEAAIQYDDDAIVVQDLRLVSSDQEISADGTFGHSGDALRIGLTNVDLAGVDALLLRAPQFSGRVDAAGTLRGTFQAPQWNAEFQVNNGGFRAFQYDTFAGTLDYEREGLTLDARLQQNPVQWITAKGYLPRALFTPGSGAEEHSHIAHRDRVAPEDLVDLTIDSSPIDLGLIQGFSNAVSAVTGTIEAHVRVTGSAADPHPVGEVEVRDGAMRVEPAGVLYTNIAGRIELQPDRVHIDQVTLLDNHDNALSLTGDLALHERQLGDMHLYVTADDFKILDNALGNVRVDSRMELAGELRSPRLEGYLGVSTGQVDVDELLARTEPALYSTEQARLDAAPSGEGEGVPPAGLFDAWQMDLQLSVPDALVVKAGSLQLPDAPIGLGALTATLGGDLRVLKARGGQLRLIGDVNTVRGSYDFQGRRFEILRDGAVRFRGFDEIDPALDIRTTRTIQAVEARVNVRGTLKHPEIVLSSVPPLEQADILSLIVFNQPINQLGAGQQISLTQRAQAIAAAAIAGQLSTSIGRALHLDTFQIDVAPEQGAAPELTIGQQLGQDLYVKVEQGLGEQSSTNFVLEYELTDWLRLQANVIEGVSTQPSVFRQARGSGADLIVFLSF